MYCSSRNRDLQLRGFGAYAPDLCKQVYWRNPQLSIKASVFIATSLDGFIARANGDLDWLTGAESASTEQDYGYQEFMDTVDTIVVGRNTFELVLTFDTWPYSGKKVVVLSSRPNAIPPHLANDVEWLSLPPQRLVGRLAAQGATHLYVDGGKTIQGFLNAGLIDELTITRVPILIGAGVPLFGPLNHDIRLTHIATRQFESGFVQSKYRVADTL
jgi:dihydrofolate reductase